MNRKGRRTKNWIALTVFTGFAAAPAAQLLLPTVSLPSSITVSPTDSAIADLNQSLQFTAQSDVGDSFPLPNVGAVQVGSGYGSCALLSDGTVHCWQNALYYPSQGPLPLPGLGGVTAIAVGSYHTCALLADTTVQCWGANFSGMLGDGTMTARDTPAPVTYSNGAPLINVT